jgi:pimeloyl-ACP methyl ester carboxylesterase
VHGPKQLSAEVLRRAAATGVAGWRDDDLSVTRAWGFEISAIRVPVAVWQGGQDLMVPFAHGEWLVTHIPGARARLLPRDC